MNKKIFNQVYARYFKRDYWATKELIRRRIQSTRESNPDIQINMMKFRPWLREEKRKCFDMIVTRLAEYKAGKHFPQREKFTHAIFKALEG